MTVREAYLEAIIGKHYSLQLVIDYLVNERKVLEMTDPQEKLTYYLQDKFHKKMNEYLIEYERKRNHEIR